MKKKEQQIWITRALVAVVVVLALMWGLASESLRFERQRTQKLDRQLRLLQEEQ